MKDTRKRALDLLTNEPDRIDHMAPEDLKALVHELHVHQIELEMQNEELLNTRHELERSQMEYTSLYDDAPVGYLILKRDGSIRRLNNLAADLLCHPRSQLIGTLLGNFIVKDEQKHFTNEFQRIMESDYAGSCEYRLQSHSGISHIHFRYQTVQLEPGEKWLRMTMTDMSDRVRTTEQLRNSQRQLEAALQISACGIWDWPDTEQDQMWWSPELYRLLGHDTGNIHPTYRTLKSLLHQSDRKRVLRMIDETIRHGQSYEGEFRLRCRNGTYRWFRSCGGTIGSTLNRRHMAGLLQDITSIHIAEEKLILAKEQAEQASQEKSMFLAAASHDLRQPLQSMAIYLGAMTRLDQSAGVADIVRKIEASIHNMQRLLRSLLNLSRLDAGLVRPTIEPFALQDLLDSLNITNAPLAQSVKRTLRIRPTALEVMGDRVLLEELIQNLVSNALQHTERGGVLVACRYRPPHVWIQVWDTGPGIPRDKLNELLIAGADVSGKHARDAAVYDGIRSGLGFAIIRRIKDILACPLRVRSVVGYGTVFSVEIPLSGRQALPVPPPVQVEKSGWSKVSILLIDDDAAVLDSYRTLALCNDFGIETAPDLSGAMRLLDEGMTPAIIISDLRLKRESGVTVIQSLRYRLGTLVPAILLTGDTSTIEADIHSIPFCKVIYKPVNFAMLLNTIEELIRT